MKQNTTKPTKPCAGIPTAELCRAMGARADLFARWSNAEGFRATGQTSGGVGRPTNLWDPAVVLEWLRGAGRHRYADRLEAYMAAQGLIRPPAPPPAVSSDDTPATEPAPAEKAGEGSASAFGAALERARKVERAAYSALAACAAAGGTAGDLAGRQARWVQAADALTRMEKIKDEVLLAEGAMIRREDAFEATARILRAVRVDLEALPNNLAVRLEGLSLPEIAARLREAVEGVLRHLYAGDAGGVAS